MHAGTEPQDEASTSQHTGASSGEDYRLFSRHVERPVAQTWRPKVVVLGNIGVGKTSLIETHHRVTDQLYSASKVAHPMTAIHPPTVNVNIYFTSTTRALVELWDTPGVFQNNPVKDATFVAAKGAIVVCDLSQDSTITAIETTWIPLLEEYRLDKYVILGNKRDLISATTSAKGYNAATRKLANLALKHNTAFLQTSAIENIEPGPLEDALSNVLDQIRPALDGTWDAVSLEDTSPNDLRSAAGEESASLPNSQKCPCT